MKMENIKEKTLIDLLTMIKELSLENLCSVEEESDEEFNREIANDATIHRAALVALKMLG